MSRASFELVLWTSTAVDLAVVLVLLLAPVPGRSGPAAGEACSRLGLARVSLTAVATAAVVGVKLAFLVRMGLDALFGVVHLLFLDAAVVLPAAAAVVLARGLRRRGRRLATALTRPVAGLAVAGLLAAPVGAYASFVEPFSLRVERTRVPVAEERRGDGRPIRVGVLADIQTTHVSEHERDAVEQVMRLRPDVIVLPGDLFQASRERLERELPALRALLGRLSAPGGVYFVEGDADNHMDLIDRLVVGTDVRVLRNEQTSVRVRGRRVTIAGVDLDWETPAAQRTMRRLHRARGGEDLRLLVAHRPDAALSLAAGRRTDLFVTGHTHGGQFQIPFYGAPVTASQVGRTVGAGGLHRVAGGRLLYVSRGIGVERGQAPRMRFLAPPEVSLLYIGGARRAPAGIGE